jgi:hypothetical protein
MEDFRILESTAAVDFWGGRGSLLADGAMRVVVVEPAGVVVMMWTPISVGVAVLSWVFRA